MVVNHGWAMKRSAFTPSRRQDFVSSKWQFYNPDYLTPAGLAGIPSPAELERGRFGKKPW